MPAESLRKKGTGNFSRVVGQQLRFHTMDPGRLLQGFDDVREQPLFNLAPVGSSSSIAHKQVADHAIALLVHKKRIAKNVAALNRGIAGKNLGLHVAENHLGRLCVVPGKKASPERDLFLQQRSKIGGREMAEIEDFHREARQSQVSRFQSFKVSK